MIRLDHARYAPGGTELVSDLTLSFEAGRITALVGPSGCGKSTLLRLLAGLRPLDAGRVEGIPERRAFVFQDAALLPWLDLRANVALPGRYGPIGDVDAALDAVGIRAQARQLPRTLSGGQKMRASLARALVSRPELVLLDEAFSALDGVTRRAVQATFLALQAERGWTVVMVTHELEDAARLADRVVALAGPPVRVLADLPVTSPRGPVADDTVLRRLVEAYA